jgi:hypothetical protein
MPRTSNALNEHWRRLFARNQTRNRNHELIHSVRKGNIRQLFPAELEFQLTFDGSPIANFVDIVARDMAEGIAPLPALACVSGRMETEADRRRAERKNRIGDHYWRESNLEIQMLTGADHYVTYGFLPMVVLPDETCNTPYIRLESPRHAYYELDRRGNCINYARSTRKSIDALCAMFPEAAPYIKTDPRTKRPAEGNQELEIVRWIDKTNVTLFIPEREGLILQQYSHKMTRTPVWIATRPGDDYDNPRGQFDDVIWVQVARSMMSAMALEAASIAVQAPTVVPDSVDELPVGPHAIISGPAQDLQQVKKLNLELPNSIFAEGQVLDQELRVGARYPEARSGTPGTSVITGKGVEALLGTFDSQIKGSQLVFKRAFEQITSMCFEMDEAWWPEESKKVSGTISGTSFELTYVPSKDIASRWDCTVTYGFAAGLQPEQSSILMLQLQGAGLIAKSTVSENLAWAVDSVMEERKINIESSREALKQGVFALVQSSGQMAAAGQDPTPIIQLAVDMINGLEGGQTIESAVQKAFTTMQQTQKQAQQAQMEQMQQMQAAQGGAPGGGGAPDGADAGLGPGGLPAGVAPGQAGLPPGGRPSLDQMITGMRGDGSVPVMQNEVRRSVPIGTS